MQIMPRSVQPVLTVHQNRLGSLKSIIQGRSQNQFNQNLWGVERVTQASVTLKGIQISSIFKVDNHGD